ncbi:hypothetical protein AXF42_Ash014092 [Apostasia shenzhenica]|uniref:Uncharacterized protein n=1 Tax=Apostasia shenzhenica TaxID=1088818 RepID=A0A2I0A9F6_9ASPA|nr:hypothetical protein AXF42_Ash014092 [Apostasia shenzhenica]
MEKELQRREEAFQADLFIVNGAEFEQEKRAIQEEETLRKARLNYSDTAEKLQEEFKRPNAQISTAF